MKYHRLIKSKTQMDFTNKSKIYFGIDPTGLSLHLGHLIPLQLAKEMQEDGWEIIILLGGYTGQIGDPSGKSKIRSVVSQKEIDYNSQSILKMLEHIFPPHLVTYVNNKDWLNNMNLSQFLEYSKHMSVNQLTKLDTFKKRLNNNLPLALSEFSYTTLQAIDFLHLNKTLGATVQIGGQDQWGNIATGVSFVKKQVDASQKKMIGGITTELLTINGQKIGKTTGHNLKLAQSSIQLFTNIYNLPDTTIEQLLFIFLNKEGSTNNKENRYELIEYIFQLSNKKDYDRTKEIYTQAMQEISSPELILEMQTMSIIDILEQILKTSRTECKKKIKNNAISLNGQKIQQDKTLALGMHIIKYSKTQLPLFIKII